MATVRIKVVTEDEKRLAKELANSEKRADALQRKLDNTGRTGKKAFGDITTQAKTLASSLIGPVSVGAAVAKLVLDIKGAYEEIREAHKDYANKMKNTGQSRNKGLWDAYKTFGEDEKKFDMAAARIAQKANAPLDRVYETLGAGATAGGEGKLLTTSTTRAVQLERRGLGDAGEFVSGGITLGKITDMDDADVNFGYLNQVGGASKVQGLGKQVRLVDGMNALRQHGATAEFAGEFTAAISQLMLTDAEGRITSSGIRGLTEKLATGNLIPEQKTNLKTGEKEIEWKRVQGDNFLERLKNLQDAYTKADAELKKQIIKQYAAEKTFAGALKEIISGSPKYQHELKKAMRKIDKPGNESKIGFLKLMKATASGDFSKMQDASSSAHSAIANRGITKKAADAATEEAKEIFYKYLKQTYDPVSYAVNYTMLGFNEMARAPQSQTRMYHNIIKRDIESRHSLGGEPADENEKAILAALNKLVEIASGNIDINKDAAKNLAATASNTEQAAKNTADTARNTVKSADPNSQEK